MKKDINFDARYVIRKGNEFLQTTTQNKGVFPVSMLPEALNCQTPDEVWSKTLDGDTYDHETKSFLAGADLSKPYCCLLNNENVVTLDEVDIYDFVVELINQEAGWDAFVEWLRERGEGKGILK